jgi:hypothetical protein
MKYAVKKGELINQGCGVEVDICPLASKDVARAGMTTPIDQDASFYVYANTCKVILS